MRYALGFLLGVFMAISLFAPTAEAATGFSFGGRIVKVIPCASPLGPSLHVTIVPAGVFAPTYIWTPTTITFLFGVPRNPGQQILGVADTPFVCYIPAKVPIPLYGLRMQVVGTSLF